MTRLHRGECTLLVIDVQERLLPVIHTTKEVERRIAAAVAGARALGLPVIVTEQYPKGLGRTAGTVAEAVKGIEPIEKLSFSCCGADAVNRALAGSGHATVLLSGIESHVCVLQTCLDLVERGITPVVLADCMGSRHRLDHELAVDRMRGAGALVTTLESALFELVGAAGTDEFRAISAIIKPL